MKRVVLVLAVLAGGLWLAADVQAGQWGRRYYRPAPAWGYPAYPSYGYGYPVYGPGYYPVYPVYPPVYPVYPSFGSRDPFAGSPSGGNYWYWLSRQYSQGRISKSDYLDKVYGNR